MENQVPERPKKTKAEVEAIIAADLEEVKLRIFEKYGIEFIDLEPEERTRIYKETFLAVISETVN